MVKPLTLLTKKNQKFEWGEAQPHAFETLKSAFTSAPVLRHFDPTREITLKTDASNLFSAGILSQPDDEGIQHPVAFYSKKHSPTECGYSIYDKELLAIVLAFKHWRPLLEGATHPVQVITDHRNLIYFTRNRLLNYRQIEWSEFLSRFTFKIAYRPGTLHAKADALTRQQDQSEEENEERQAHRMQTVLKSQNLGLLADIPPANGRSHFDTLLDKAYEADPFPSEVIASLLSGQRTSNKISLHECEIRDERLYYCDRLFIPDYPELQLYLLQQHHNVPSAGHCGQAKTFKLLAREYTWFGMRKDVHRYIQNCHICQRSHTPRHYPSGVLRPLPIPYRPWSSISMDFVTGLPWSNGNDAIWVVVDCLTKMHHFVPCQTIPAPPTWRTSFYNMYGNTTVSPKISSPIEFHSLPVTSGDSSAPVLESHPAYPLFSIPKLMDKQNEQIRQWSGTFVPLSPTSKTTGRTGYQWPSLWPTTNSRRQPRLLPSSPTPVTTPGAPLTCPPPPVGQKISKPWELPQNTMRSMNSFVLRLDMRKQNNRRTPIDPGPPPPYTNSETKSGSMPGISQPVAQQSSLITNAWDPFRLLHLLGNTRVASSYLPP